jgi:hypothetical protein
MTTSAVRLLALAALSTLTAVAARAGTIPTPTFDWNPRPLHLDGSKFTADTVQLSDYGQIIVSPTTGAFTEAGYLPILGFALDGGTVSPSGFDAASGDGWGAYVRYQATGTQVVTPNGISATYASLSYSIYGFNGLATYGLDANGVAYESGGTNLTLLGDGNLIDGSLTLVPAAFVGTTPVQFSATGNVRTISDVPHQFSSNTFLGFDVNVVHPPGELFPISATTFEADGGSSSTATLIASRGNSAHANRAAMITTVPEPGSGPLFAVGLISIGILRRRRRQRALAVAPPARTSLRPTLPVSSTTFSQST